MCGRFARTSSIDTFAQLFQAQGTVELAPSYNIAPTQDLLVARTNADGLRELAILHWGLIPHWSKGPDPKYSMINARADTLTSKPAYREPFKRRRCLIAADGFYEWAKTEHGKQPYYIHLRGRKPFAFAGLWDHWEHEGEVIESCTIITTDANARVATIHDRMPVVLPQKAYEAWLDPTQMNPFKLLPLLVPYPDTLTEAYPVSRAVNSPKTDTPDLINPDAGDKGGSVR